MGKLADFLEKLSSDEAFEAKYDADPTGTMHHGGVRSQPSSDRPRDQRDREADPRGGPRRGALEEVRGLQGQEGLAVASVRGPRREGP
jgi:hypothetical protein